MNSKLSALVGLRLRGALKPLPSPGRKILVSARVAECFRGPIDRVLVFEIDSYSKLASLNWNSDVLHLADQDVIPDVDSIVVLADERMIADAVRARCLAARAGGLEIVQVENFNDVPGAVARALSSALDAAEQDAARATAAQGALRTDHRLLHRAAARLRTIIELAGIDVELHEAARVVPSTTLAPVAAVRLRQRLPDFHPLLRLVRIKLHPASLTFEESTGLLTATITSGRHEKIYSQVAMPPPFLINGVLEIAIPILPEPREALWLTLDWDGPVVLAPRAAIARHGMGGGFDVLQGSVPISGAMIAAEYFSGYLGIEPLPPVHTVVSPLPSSSDWRGLPPHRLASVRLLTPAQEDFDMSLCVFDHSSGELLVHPVESGGETWAMLSGAFAPGVRIVEAEISLGEQAVGSVEFGMLMVHVGSELEVYERSSMTNWTCLSAGERSIVRYVLKQPSAGAVSLLLGTRMSDDKVPNWWAHARFNLVRFSSSTEPLEAEVSHQ
jgi:hypothetical protein